MPRHKKIGNRSAEGTQHQSKEEVEKKSEAMEEVALGSLDKEHRKQREAANRHNKELVAKADGKLKESEKIERRDLMATRVKQDSESKTTSLSEYVPGSGTGADEKAREEGEKDLASHKKLNEATGSSKEARNLWAQYIIAGAGIVSTLTAVSGMIYMAAKDSADGRDDYGLRDPEIERLYKAWNEKSDDVFWTELANYVERNEEDISLTDEANMMKVIVSMSRDTGFVWQSLAAFSDAADEFVKDIVDAKTGPAYRNLLVRKYAPISAPTVPQLLPRRQAAELLASAIARYTRKTLERN